MITFKEYITEARKEETNYTGPHTAQKLKELIGSTRFNSIIKHPYYKKYIASGGTDTHLFTHRINNLGDHEVEAYGVHSMFDKNEHGKIEPKHKIRFDTYKGRVTNAHYFKNSGRWNSSEPSLNGKIHWTWVHSHKNEE